MEVKDKVVTVEGLKGAYDNLNGKISSNDTDIANLQNSVTQLNSELTRMSFFSNDRENCTFPANTSEYYRISVPDVPGYVFYPTEIETSDDSLIFLRYERENNNIILYFRNISTTQKTATIHIEGFYVENK